MCCSELQQRLVEQQRLAFRFPPGTQGMCAQVRPGQRLSGLDLLSSPHRSRRIKQPSAGSTRQCPYWHAMLLLTWVLMEASRLPAKLQLIKTCQHSKSCGNK